MPHLCIAFDNIQDAAAFYESSNVNELLLLPSSETQRISEVVVHMTDAGLSYCQIRLKPVDENRDHIRYLELRRLSDVAVTIKGAAAAVAFNSVDQLRGADVPKSADFNAVSDMLDDIEEYSMTQCF